MSRTPAKLFDDRPFWLKFFSADWEEIPHSTFVCENARQVAEYLDLWRQFQGGKKPLGSGEAELFRTTKLITVEIYHE